MHKIGLIGGMSWHSTLAYYRILNERVAAAHGGHASAPIVLESLDFAEIRDCQCREDWDLAGRLLARAATNCEHSGAHAVAICTNLMHKVAPTVRTQIDIPLLHIADAVGSYAAAQGWSRIGVLGTRWVMEESFYADVLSGHGVEAVVPGPDDRDAIDRVIFDELTQGRIRADSRAAYVGVIERLAARGAQAVVLACTEIGLLVGDDVSPLPLIDSAEAHARALAEVALREPAGV